MAERGCQGLTLFPSSLCCLGSEGEMAEDEKVRLEEGVLDFFFISHLLFLVGSKSTSFPKSSLFCPYLNCSELILSLFESMSFSTLFFPLPAKERQ